MVIAPIWDTWAAARFPPPAAPCRDWRAPDTPGAGRLTTRLFGNLSLKSKNSSPRSVPSPSGSLAFRQGAVCFILQYGSLAWTYVQTTWMRHEVPFTHDIVMNPFWNEVSSIISERVFSSSSFSISWEAPHEASERTPSTHSTTCSFVNCSLPPVPDTSAETRLTAFRQGAVGFSLDTLWTV